MTGPPVVSPEESNDCDIVITRIFDAPREVLWDAWTDSEQIARWWGPRGFTTTIHKMDLRPGGDWISTMHGPDGTDYFNRCVFSEVVKPERIVYTMTGGKEGSRHQCESTWTFEAQGRRTRLTLRMRFPSAEIREEVAKLYGVAEGGHQTLDRLEEYLHKEQGNGPKDDGKDGIKDLVDDDGAVRGFAGVVPRDRETLCHPGAAGSVSDDGSRCRDNAGSKRGA